MKNNLKKLILFILLGGGILHSGELTGADILRKVDENYNAKNHRSVSTMMIKGRRGTRTMKARSWTQGTNKSFTEYLSPARDAGTKMLKLKNELWIYLPAADRIIKIAGHMLRRSMMGSDISYEDFMEDQKLSDIYDVKLEAGEKIDGRLCYVLKLTAKIKKVTYNSRKMWIDKERFLPLKEERFAKSGKLLKLLTIDEVFKAGKRWYPKKMTFKDVLQRGQGTVFIIDSIEFNVKIPAHIFSKASLRK